MKTISIYNDYMILRQTYNIVRTLHYIKSDLSEEKRVTLSRNQVENAIQWCLKYHIEINYKSSYLTSKDRTYINKYLKNNYIYK